MVGHHYGESVYGREVEDSKGQKCPHAREKGRSEELRAVRNWLMWMACLPRGAMEMSGPGLLPMVMSGLLFLTQLWRSVLMPVAPLTKGPVDAWSLGYHIGPCCG